MSNVRLLPKSPAGPFNMMRERNRGDRPEIKALRRELAEATERSRKLCEARVNLPCGAVGSALAASTSSWSTSRRVFRELRNGFRGQVEVARVELDSDALVAIELGGGDRRSTAHEGVENDALANSWTTSRPTRSTYRLPEQLGPVVAQKGNEKAFGVFYPQEKDGEFIQKKSG